MKTNRTIIFMASFFFLTFSAGETLAFRCGLGLVSSGDSKTQVIQTCGKPTSKEKACDSNQQYTSLTKNGKVKKHKKCGRKLDVWRYNCGDNDFIYRLTFDDNKVTDVTTEGRGSGKSDCNGK